MEDKHIQREESKTSSDEAMSPQSVDAPDDDDEQGSVFEITDFSNASPFEKFVSKIEETIRKWIESDEVSEFRTENIKYARRIFKLNYYNCFGDDTSYEKHDIMKQLLNTKNEFPSRAHHLQRWFGIKEFLVLLPAGEWTDASDASMLLSALTVANNNLQRYLPCFVPIGDTRSGVYVGRWQGASGLTRFRADLVKEIPPLCTHLSGLLDMFSLNIGTTGSSSLRRSPIQISARYTYILEQFDTTREWKRLMAAENDDVPIYLMEWGTTHDPIEAVHVAGRWSAFDETMLKDNSDLHPEDAPYWSIRSIHADKNEYECILAETLRSSIDVYIDSLISCLYEEEQRQQYLKALREKNTGDASPPSPSQSWARDIQDRSRARVSFRNALKSAYVVLRNSRGDPIPPSPSHGAYGSPKNQYKSKTPLEELQAAIRAIFEVSWNKNDRKEAYAQQQMDDATAKKIEELKKGLPKSCPPDSLLSLLAVQAAFVEDWAGIKQLWHYFLKEIREHWETSTRLPHIPHQVPDWSTSLLLQKLTMLDYCIKVDIEAKKNKAKGENESADGWDAIPDDDVEIEQPDNQQEDQKKTEKQQQQQQQQQDGWDGWDDDDDTMKEDEQQEQGDTSEEDEFYDAMDTTEANFPTATATTTIATPTTTTTAEVQASSSLVQSPTTINKTEDEKKSQQQEESAVAAGEEGGVQREGALKPLEGVYLLKMKDTPLYIPITQEHPPMTEDMIMQQQEVFSKLGTSEEATRIRARMQSASMLSDMQAFKAANPFGDDKVLLEDFIRWYSPKDFVPPSPEQLNNGDNNNANNVETQQQGLSARMQVQKNNLWRQVWESAKPIPAHKQKPLFDHVREAELVLHYIETLPPMQWMHEIIVTLLVTAYHSLLSAPAALLPPVYEALLSLKSKLIAACDEDYLLLQSNPSNSSVKPLLDQFKTLCDQFERVEALLSICTSLLFRFEDQKEIVSTLCMGLECILNSEEKLHFTKQCIEAVKECCLTKGNTEFVIDRLTRQGRRRSSGTTSNNNNDSNSKKARRELKEPDAREFIFRSNCPRPSSQSKPTSQLMYTLLSDTEFRIATAISQTVPF